MKKFISFVLLLAMSLSLFAGCADTEANPTETVSDLTAARNYLYSMYKDAAEVTNMDYTVVGVVAIGGVSYPVIWTTDSDAVKVVPGDNKMVTIDVPDAPEAEITYKLTGTITDAEGKTETVSFTHIIPAAAGSAATIADGTYVITAGKLTMSSLASDKGYGYPTATEVTISGGAVTGHTAADVLTIKNVEGGITIQDAYGRYFYLKGTYNSFNVDATAPAEGHIWELLADGDKYILVNAMNKKTLAYSTSYSSWGAYPELTDDHTSLVTITAATAPKEDPKPNEQPSTPSTPSGVNPGTYAPMGGVKPVVNMPYLFAMYQGKSATVLYFTGKMDGFYLATSDKASDAVAVYVEETTGGLHIYFMEGSAKKYLDIVPRGGEGNEGKISVKIVDTPSAVFTWDDSMKMLVATVEGKTWCWGTYGTYTTINASATSYFSDVTKVGTEQHMCEFIGVPLVNA